MRVRDVFFSGRFLKVVKGRNSYFAVPVRLMTIVIYNDMLCAVVCLNSALRKVGLINVRWPTISALITIVVRYPTSVLRVFLRGNL